jgi:hypothetical protein
MYDTGNIEPSRRKNQSRSLSTVSLSPAAAAFGTRPPDAGSVGRLWWIVS